MNTIEQFKQALSEVANGKRQLVHMTKTKIVAAGVDWNSIEQLVAEFGLKIERASKQHYTITKIV